MKRLGIAIVSLACVLASGSTAGAGEADWLFEPDHVTEIDLDLSAESRAALDADPGEYVEGTFSLARDDGTTYGPLVVGVRLKGNASFRTLDGKAAFKLKFNEFVKGQTFLGLKKLTLNNMVQDQTMLHELLAYEAFREAGLPSWRTGYSFVRINGDAYGVYLNIETPDNISLKRSYPTTQHLYEGEWGSEVVATQWYEVEEGDDEDLADLEALIAAVADWQDVGDVADLEQMTRYWAVERYIGQFDGYTGATPNNYYLHSDDDGRFTMLPWGTDQAMVRRLVYDDPGGLMFNRCLADEACLELYRDAVADVRATLGAVDFTGMAADTAALLEPWAQMDPRREHTIDEMRAWRWELNQFLAARPGDNVWRVPAPAMPPADEEAGGDGGTSPDLSTGSTHIDTAPFDERPPTAVAAAGPTGLSIQSVLRDRSLLNANVHLPGSGHVTMDAYAAIDGKRRTVCRSAARAKPAGAVKSRCRLTPAARRLLRSKQLRVAVSVRYVPAAGPAQAVARSVTLR